MKLRDLKELSLEDKFKKLKELRAELLHERSAASMGGSLRSPGKIKALRKTIARILTLIKEEKEKSE
jgi:large subunit ribosomal protein L29